MNCRCLTNKAESRCRHYRAYTCCKNEDELELNKLEDEHKHSTKLGGK